MAAAYLVVAVSPLQSPPAKVSVGDILHQGLHLMLLLLSISGNSLRTPGSDHVDDIMHPAIANFGVKIINIPNAVSVSTVNVEMALMLASARRLVEGHIATSPDTTHFAVDWLGVEVTWATLGIFGMGSIGYNLAKRAKAFDMNILCHNRNHRKEEEEQAIGATYCKNIEDLLRQSDFVMLVVNLTSETHKLIGKRELQLMKPTATLINICRGAVVDQDALVEALQNGVIKAAALDVADLEPLPRDHLLLLLKNVIITPHIGTATVQALLMMTEEAVGNIHTVLNDLPSEMITK
uniref:uncharacterized protein LOC114585876 n=1 Tax=Podarcis muralis TaxID=64176 RepID=UPI0010A0710E|nr:uncharacterized protein LOC114585876 [Podarcis muralis]